MEISISALARCRAQTAVQPDVSGTSSKEPEINHLKVVMLTAAAVANVACASGRPLYVYVTDVRLSDGVALRCTVNELPHAAGISVSPLTMRERTQADVLATQRLRLLSGPTSEYPSPYTAPSVACGSSEG
jgi:CRISPR/Cas system-associated exonuclease Cas4 (RecB family)